MERRQYERIPTSIEARFCHNDMFYSGTIMNISEQGMFISTKKCFPSDTIFVVILDTEDYLFKINAVTKRIDKDTGCNRGMGIELLSPVSEYLDFLETLKAAA